jgi:hypothetical protein
MYVVRLPDGRLRVPASALARGSVIGHAYVEIGPDDPDYQRLLERSITESEMAEKRRRWRADDDELRREFEEFKTRPAEE